MPEKRTLERARRAKRQGKASTTQAGEFVREEMHHKKSGKHTVKNKKQAIAIGLNKARRAGVALKKPRKAPAKAKAKAKKSATSASRKTVRSATTRTATTRRRRATTAAKKPKKTTRARSTTAKKKSASSR